MRTYKYNKNIYHHCLWREVDADLWRTSDLFQFCRLSWARDFYCLSVVTSVLGCSEPLGIARGFKTDIGWVMVALSSCNGICSEQQNWKIGRVSWFSVGRMRIDGLNKLYLTSVLPAVAPRRSIMEARDSGSNAPSAPEEKPEVLWLVLLCWPMYRPSASTCNKRGILQ